MPSVKEPTTDPTVAATGGEMGVASCVPSGYFGTTPEVLISDLRGQPLCRCRQIAMYVARAMTGRSMPVIGYYMGNRDHTTILRGARAIKSLLDAGDAETVAAVSAIKERLQVLRTGRA